MTLRIEKDDKVLTVASAPVSSDEARAYVAILMAKKSKSHYVRYPLDGNETTPNDPDAVLDFRTEKLAPLSPFRLTLNEVNLNLDAPASQASLDAFRPFLEQRSNQPIVRCLLSAYCNGEEQVERYGDHWISCGWERSGESPHYSVGVRHKYSLANVPQCADYFARAIAQAGLADRIQVNSDGENFTVDADQPDELWISGADIRRRNPDVFRYYGLASFREAWTCFERILVCPELVERINRINLFMRMPPPVYEQLMPACNELADNWAVSLYGAYADGIDPYTAEPPQAPTGRFPVFHWSPRRQDAYYQADIVVTADGRRVEIHSNCGDPKKIVKQASVGTLLKFTPVEKTGDEES